MSKDGRETNVEQADAWRIPWGNVWASVARVYYLIFAGVLFFKMLTLIAVEWVHLLIAGTIPAVFVLIVLFVDGVWIWYIRKRPAWKEKGLKHGDDLHGDDENRGV